MVAVTDAQTRPVVNTPLSELSIAGNTKVQNQEGIDS